MNTDLILPLAVDLLLKSSAILILTWLALRMWRRASAAQRGCVWCVAFAVIALLPFTRLAAPHWTLELGKAAAPVKLSQTRVHRPAPMMSGAIVSGATVRAWAMPGGVKLGAGIWAMGVFVLVAYRLAGALLLRRCRRVSFPLENDAVASLMAEIRKDFGVHRPVDVRVSRTCRVPVTWGTWLPVIMLPAEALDWPQEWLESALRHELGHVKNYDHLKRLGAFLTCAFYWPNPLVWAAAKQLQLTQEEASDNLVLRVGVSAQDYAMQLIELIRSTAGRSLHSLPAVAMARPSKLEGRLAAILDDTRNRGSADRRLILVGAGLAVALGLALGAVQLRAADVSPGKASREASFTTPGSPFVVRTFLVSKGYDLMAVKVENPARPDASGGVDVRKQLYAQGIAFSKGASAMYTPGTRRLIVRNTPDQLDLVQVLVEDPNDVLERKFKIPMSVEFEDATITEATDFIATTSGLLSPDHDGVHFVFQPDFGKSAHRFNFVAKDMPCGDLVQAVCKLANVQYKLQDGMVNIGPIPGATRTGKANASR